MSTFTWRHPTGAAQNMTPRVREAQFGDGYSQRVGDGLHSMVRSWSLSFVRPTAEIEQIEAFLQGLGGATAFDWTPPTGAAGKWICKTWSRVADYAAIQTLSATFQEVFE